MPCSRGPTRQLRPSRRSTTCTATTPKSSPRSRPAIPRGPRHCSERHVEAVTAWLQEHQPGDASRAAQAPRRPARPADRGTPRQTGRGAGGHHRRRDRRQRLAGRFGLRNRNGAAGALPGEPRGVAGGGAAARISLDRADAPRARRRAGRHKTPGAGQHRHHRALPAVPQAEPRRLAVRPGRHRDRQRRQGRASGAAESEVAAFLHTHRSGARRRRSTTPRRCAHRPHRGVSVPRRTGATGRQRPAGPVPADHRRVVPPALVQHRTGAADAGPTSSPSSTLTCGFSRRSRPATTAWPAIASVAISTPPPRGGCDTAASIRCRFVISSLHSGGPSRGMG